MPDTTKTTDTPDTDDVRTRALAAMQSVFDKALRLSTPPPHIVAEAFDAAAAVFDADHDAAVKDMMDRSLLAGMDLGPEGMTLKAITAREIAVNMAMAAAQFLDEHPGAENYVQQDVWDRNMKNRYTVIFVKPTGRTPHQLRQAAERRADRLAAELDAIRELRCDPHLLRWCAWPGCWRAYDATTGPVGEPGWMNHRTPSVLLCPGHDQAGHRPTFSWTDGDDFVAAGCQCGAGANVRPTNQQAVIDWWTEHVTAVFADQANDDDEDVQRIAAVLALADADALIALGQRDRPVDPREVATALGQPPECTCPGGPTGWHDDFDPDCPRHSTPEPSTELLAELMPAAMQGRHMAVGAHPELYDRNDPMSAMIVNVLVSILRALRTPDEGIWSR